MSPNAIDLINLNLTILCYGFVFLFIFNLLKVNYYNPIVKTFLAVYKPISKLSIFPNQLYMIGLIAVCLKFASFQLFPYEIFTIAGIRFLPNNVSIEISGVIAFIGTIIFALNIIFYSVIGSVILSWVSPNNSHPVLELIDEISNKTLNPIKKVIPSMGGLDFSPIFIFIAINVISNFLQNIIILIV